MKKVFIDPGHGGRDSGAVWEGVMEKDVVLAIAWGLRKSLEEGDYAATMSRVDDTFVGLSRRCQMANIMGSDIFLSIHCNADPDADAPGDPVARGEEVWIRPSCPDSLHLARCIQKYAKTFASVLRGIKESNNLAVLRGTEMPAALVEVGFVDDPSFTNKLPIESIVQGLKAAVEEYFNAADT